jgi:acyl-CoA thioesterase FadM
MLVTVRAALGKLGERSFTVSFRLTDPAGRALATASTAHVAVDRATLRPVPLPEPLRALLAPHLEEQAG